jgi:hypothetical protein
MQNMQDPSGWSFTSGGPSAGIIVSQYGDSDHHCIFDQNSGPARVISGSLSVRSVDMTNSAFMDFSTLSSFNISRASVLRAKFKDMYLWWYSQDTQVTKPIDMRGCEVIGVINIGASWELAAPLNISGVIKILGSTAVEAFLYARGNKVTCAALQLAGGGSNYRANFYAGGGELELTGARADWGGGTNIQYAILAIPTACNFHMQGGTLRVSNKDANVNKVLSGAIDSALSNTNLGNFINDTTGGVEWVGGANGYVTNFVSYDAGKGTLNRFALNNYYYAGAWILDGAGQYTTLQTANYVAGATKAQIMKTGGGQIVANYCKFQNLTLSTGTSIKALNSVDLGGNAGGAITYSFVNSRFLSHYHC